MILPALEGGNEVEPNSEKLNFKTSEEVLMAKKKKKKRNGRKQMLKELKQYKSMAEE